jgi:hypothetical protein
MFAALLRLAARCLWPAPDRINYYEYLQSTTWRAKAQAAKRRAHYRCWCCSGRQRLEAHHRTYARLGHERPDDLRVLCHRCHTFFSQHRTLARWLGVTLA